MWWVFELLHKLLVYIDGTSIGQTSSSKVNASLTGAHQKAYTDAFQFIKSNYLQENYTR